VLDLRNVTSLTNGQNWNTHLAIQALAGGQVDLRKVAQITDPSAGELRYRSVDVSADGTNSTVNLSALTALACFRGSTTGSNRYSTLVAKNGGTIQANALTTLTGVNLVLDGTGTFPTSQIAALSGTAP